VEPGLRLGFGDDREDLDFCFRNVIEHPDITNSQAVLWLPKPSKALDSALADLRRLVRQVHLERLPIVVVSIAIAGVPRFSLDAYVVETLMPDLVLHDHQPSAFLVYLLLAFRAAGSRRGRGVPLSHQAIADATGLSKSAVQAAIRTLVRRRLVRATRMSITAVPEYEVLRPWRR